VSTCIWIRIWISWTHVNTWNPWVMCVCVCECVCECLNVSEYGYGYVDTCKHVKPMGNVDTRVCHEYILLLLAVEYQHGIHKHTHRHAQSHTHTHTDTHIHTHTHSPPASQCHTFTHTHTSPACQYPQNVSTIRNSPISIYSNHQTIVRQKPQWRQVFCVCVWGGGDVVNLCGVQQRICVVQTICFYICV